MYSMPYRCTINIVELLKKVGAVFKKNCNDYSFSFKKGKKKTVPSRPSILAVPCIPCNFFCLFFIKNMTSLKKQQQQLE